MRRQFLIKFFVPVKGDVFMMGEAKSHINIYCNSLVDLTKTLRCLMAKGYRVRKPAAWSNRFKYNSEVGSDNLFGRPQFRAKEIKNVPVVKPVDYTNGWGYTHKIKYTEADYETAN